MGQSATLYRIAKKDISKVIENPESFNLDEIEKGSITFEKTFEGLRFVLSKNRSVEDVDTIEQIFYPDTYAGEAIDFNNIDIDNMPVNFEVDNNAVYYNEPEAVAAITTLLNNLSQEELLASFNADELNENEVYPGEVWNNETGDNVAFNATHLATELQQLKTFFQSANQHRDYVLSFVG